MLERSVQKKLVKGCARKSAYSINKFQNKSKWKASFSSDFGDFHYCIFSVLYCGPHLEQQVIGAERKFDGMSCWPNLHTTWALGQCNVATAFVLFYSLSSTTSRSADASDNICKTPFWPLRKCGKEKKKEYDHYIISALISAGRCKEPVTAAIFQRWALVPPKRASTEAKAITLPKVIAWTTKKFIVRNSNLTQN